MRILMAEDDENDVRITRRAAERGGIAAELAVVKDGQQALDYLYRRPPFEDAVRPDLVLLDIRLPKVNGMEVLRSIKSDSELRAIPVLMLTTSARQEDVATAYAHGANAFICKPLRFAEFVEVLRSLSAYWGTLGCLAGDGPGD